MAQQEPQNVETVVVGNGPSALILSYILHGHIPFYAGGHHDPILDEKLTASPNLLQISHEFYSHFRSSLKYSSQGLPVNVLLDTLLRPHGDGDTGTSSCVEWRFEPQHAVPHIVLGDASRPGGQWANNLVKADVDIGTLSYAEQLSLPGYTFADHWLTMKKEQLPEFLRPSRTDVAEYLASYPKAAGIEDSIRTSAEVAGITRVFDGFNITSHNIHCKHLVLATGIFSINQQPPPFLRPLLELPTSSQGPVLIVGSGLTAADIIISTPPERKIIHLFNWDPETRPSPLQACHQQAYPEYAGVYRQMKRAAIAMLHGAQPPPKKSRASAATKSSMPYFAQRDWSRTYEGIPNARIIIVNETENGLPSPENVEKRHHRNSQLVEGIKTVHIGRSATGDTLTRQISTFRYATGRRGSLAYLDKQLLHEVLPDDTPNALPLQVTAAGGRRRSVEVDFADIEQPNLISGRSLRGKIEDGEGDMEIAKDVFAIGSLTGDTLIRLAFGGCAVVAGRILSDVEARRQSEAGKMGIDAPTNSEDAGNDLLRKRTTSSVRRPPFIPRLSRIFSSNSIAGVDDKVPEPSRETSRSVAVNLKQAEPTTFEEPVDGAETAQVNGSQVRCESRHRDRRKEQSDEGAGKLKSTMT